jgi:hypothetical protein
VHPPTTIRHSSSLTHCNDIDDQATAMNTHRGAFDAYMFGLNPLLVGSPKALAPSPFSFGQKSG